MSWWENETYLTKEPIPAEFKRLAGDRGVATVRAHPSGATASGWGLTPDKQSLNFIDHYFRDNLSAERRGLPFLFAFVMRSMKIVCIDIDGKNGGLQNIGKLGMLPYTLAETSKSGDGYHLFYATPWDTWDDALGFGMFKDRIGIVQGVDIRAVGCVYHYPNQLWNDRPIADLPEALKDSWLARAAKVDREIDEIVELLQGDSTDELIVVRAGLLRELAKPIPAGRRNNTLYAIGVKMMLANFPNWERAVWNRGAALGLDSQELSKLMSNIVKYQ